ncbi:proline/glycine betaine ABC transporter permease [Cereibacter azotoformans]|uniref:Glycine betaine/proline transport system permease protein n=1 Tax=Cereibacter azotoformans TaxID=43057 RepID=A0A2T5JV94_9RHOB|nr:proline/glycine betaine ABC transporter permease [Cereibacter azotoformans]AXQ94793.1 proline/glycine betaine ABC transporter permease [Cereibacter sphaeroides]MBO4170348.1 proline/glycine betaine ABC transporter permease [Cereibacter azotoformans]PTR14094.1 glycine betaine/proline transport system permease protein [Cereibacter azotoformans]UIJ30360.1 proline/glycine betaine ABC transporter permease [Cereibacter azotoformans]
MASACWGLPDAFCQFPAMDGKSLLLMRRTIDGTFRDIVRSWSGAIDAATAPLQIALNALERAFTSTPWIVVLALVLAIVWAGSRSWRIVAGTAVAMLAIGWFGLWRDTMVTLAMVSVCTAMAVVIGLPIGIAAARSDRMQRVINPVLDVMQTLPSFVYLIPVVVIFGIGKVPGMIAVVIYAVPPMIRLTNLGIRLVDAQVLEAAEAFGSSGRQKLWNVQLPLALPALMTGVNQTIMMALSMVVVASMVGVGGLGKNVLQAINNQFFTLGFLNGFALVAIAIIFDRTSQAFGQRLQQYRGAAHD